MDFIFVTPKKMKILNIFNNRGYRKFRTPTRSPDDARSIQAFSATHCQFSVSESSVTGNPSGAEKEPGFPFHIYSTFNTSYWKWNFFFAPASKTPSFFIIVFV